MAQLLNSLFLIFRVALLKGPFVSFTVCMMCVPPQVYCGLLCVLCRVLCEKNQNFAAALNFFIILAALTCFYDIALSSLEEWRLGHDL